MKIQSLSYIIRVRNSFDTFLFLFLSTFFCNQKAERGIDMHSNRPLVELFGLTFNLSIILTTIIAALIVFLFISLCTKKLKEGTPGKWQNFLEWMIEQVEKMMLSSIGNRDNLFILSSASVTCCSIVSGLGMGLLSAVPMVSGKHFVYLSAQSKPISSFSSQWCILDNA